MTTEQTSKPVRQSDGSYLYRGFSIAKHDYLHGVCGGRTRVQTHSVRVVEWRLEGYATSPAGKRTWLGGTIGDRTLAKAAERVDRYVAAGWTR